MWHPANQWLLQFARKEKDKCQKLRCLRCRHRETLASVPGTWGKSPVSSTQGTTPARASVLLQTAPSRPAESTIPSSDIYCSPLGTGKRRWRWRQSLSQRDLDLAQEQKCRRARRLAVLCRGYGEFSAVRKKQTTLNSTVRKAQGIYSGPSSGRMHAKNSNQLVS